MSQVVSETSTTDRPRETAGLYARLEERIMARDQVGASGVYYDLVRAGRPLTEIVAEGVRIHAPYTHVPYHRAYRRRLSRISSTTTIACCRPVPR